VLGVSRLLKASLAYTAQALMGAAVLDQGDLILRAARRRGLAHLTELQVAAT